MNRFPLVRLIVGLSVGFFGTLASFYLVDRYGDAPPAEPSVVELGEPDYDRYCADLPGEFMAALVEDHADGWRCVGLVDGFFAGRAVDIGLACSSQYGGDALADLVAPGDPRGWRCIAIGT